MLGMITTEITWDINFQVGKFHATHTISATWFITIFVYAANNTYGPVATLNITANYAYIGAS